MKHPSHEAPTAPWILGQDIESDQSYVIHTNAPAFIAKLADDDDRQVAFPSARPSKDSGTAA